MRLRAFVIQQYIIDFTYTFDKLSFFILFVKKIKVVYIQLNLRSKAKKFTIGWSEEGLRSIFHRISSITD